MRVVLYLSHVDDDILGAGALIPQMLDVGHEVHVVYVTDGLLHPPKDVDNRPKARRAAEILGVDEGNVHFLGFPNQRFDDDALIDLNKQFESLDLEPDLIVTNAKTDVNQDHRMVFESAMVVGRSIDRQVGIMTCEVQGSSEWNDVRYEPNFYVDVESTLDRKIEAMKEIDTEIEDWPHPRSERGMRVKAHQRGMEVGLEAAEAFRIVRWFDWDESLTPGGVIVEPTERSHIVDAVLETFREFGHEPDREYVTRVVDTGAGPHETVDGFDTDPADFWNRRESATAAAQIAATRAGGKQPYADVGFVDRLDARIGLVSNNQAETVEFLLDYHALPAFETAYGRAPSLTGASRRKPEPYYIEQAMDDLGTTDALYVGDSEKDIVAAHRAGIDSAFLRREHVEDVSLNVTPTYEVSDLEELVRRLDGRESARPDTRS